jgi:EAL domain-containing protein (putative c-di-GMP-specific phosphodiesterase class I)
MPQRYYLESSGKDASLPRRLSLDDFPAVIGRHPECQVQLGVDRVSRRHARVDCSGPTLVVEDLGSTNGTFVNHRQILQPTVLNVGDVVHFADHEFRLMVSRSAEHAGTRGDETMVGMAALPRDFPLKMPAFFELLAQGLVAGFCQPIVTSSGEPFALELLGRSAHPSLNEGAGELFALAAALDSEVRLSRLLRQCCFEEASRSGLTMPLFFNNHPAECEDLDDLMDELRRLRGLYPELALVFEVHESAVTDLGAMAEVKRELSQLGIGLAYDDFGAGQARLLELAEVPPDYLKFDMGLVRDLTESDSVRYRMLESLNGMIVDLGVRTLVEGVELEETVELCRRIGIDYMQGYYFGRPRPIGEAG